MTYRDLKFNLDEIRELQNLTDIELCQFFDTQFPNQKLQQVKAIMRFKNVSLLVAKRLLDEYYEYLENDTQQDWVIVTSYCVHIYRGSQYDLDQALKNVGLDNKAVSIQSIPDVSKGWLMTKSTKV